MGRWWPVTGFVFGLLFAAGVLLTPRDPPREQRAARLPGVHAVAMEFGAGGPPGSVLSGAVPDRGRRPIRRLPRPNGTTTTWASPTLPRGRPRSERSCAP